MVDTLAMFTFVLLCAGEHAKKMCANFSRVLLWTCPFQARNLLLVCDNHGSHRSYYVRDYLRYRQVQVLFMPAYSSPLNSCEFVWGLVKRKFATEFAKKTRTYEFTELNFKNDIISIVNRVKANSISIRMLKANEKYC